MPITRDARTDRRRRLLREQTEDETPADGGGRRSQRKAVPPAEPAELAGGKRKAGYSQDVRRACGHRLVQLIPVRRRSFSAVCAVSLLIPGLLLMAHYFIHVTGQWPWWRHPLAVAFDAGHPRSIAAWLSSQLWLLCLAATVLTFQLRRHKLDDYNGEYRLWFWLVLTCLVASVDATTNITKLFALALDHWTQSNLGWSGPAVVDATLAVLIGMLGLRMCTELKSVPLSLLLWLTGLVAWAGSAALARPELTLEMSAPIRYWLTASLWLAGLTLVWLSALTFLRSVYVEAQLRFLQRGLLASSGVPLGQRLRQSMPAMPKMPAMWRRGSASAAEAATVGNSQIKRKRRAAVDTAGDTAGDATPASTPSANAPAHSTPLRNAVDQAALPSTGPASDSSPQDELKTSRWSGWLRRPKNDDQADEYRKLSATDRSSVSPPAARPATQSKMEGDSRPSQSRNQRSTQNDGEAAEVSTASSKRSWLPKLSRPKLPRPKLPGIKLPSIKVPKFGLPKIRKSQLTESQLADSQAAKPQDARPHPPQPAKTRSHKPPKTDAPTSGRSSWFKLPRLSLSAFKLQPPAEGTSPGKPQTTASSSAPSSPSAPRREPPQEMRSVDSQRPLPGTQGAAEEMFEPYEDDDDNDGRNLSKAERKRLRRNQQQRRSA